MRGAASLDANIGKITSMSADNGCTILESCDQCGRRVLRPHVSNGRAYCAACCPTCARAAAATRTF
jgi:hypothetical protein